MICIGGPSHGKWIKDPGLPIVQLLCKWPGFPSVVTYEKESAVVMTASGMLKITVLVCTMDKRTADPELILAAFMRELAEGRK